ncbi:hypothetical protein TeGR_g4396, partial [Tetraparma gracilis]
MDITFQDWDASPLPPPPPPRPADSAADSKALLSSHTILSLTKLPPAPLRKLYLNTFPTTHSPPSPNRQRAALLELLRNEASAAATVADLEARLEDSLPATLSSRPLPPARDAPERRPRPPPSAADVRHLRSRVVALDKGPPSASSRAELRRLLGLLLRLSPGDGRAWSRVA